MISIKRIEYTLLLLASIAIIGCSKDGKLPNGYEAISTNARNRVIANSMDVVIVESNVTSYEVLDSYIVGIRVKEKPVKGTNSYDNDHSGDYGRFALNYNTGELFFFTTDVEYQKFIHDVRMDN